MIKKYVYEQKNKKSRLSLLLITLGFAIIVYTVSPVLTLHVKNILSQDRNVISPTSNIVNGLDYSRASNWFPSGDVAQKTKNPITSYSLSIPKLGIQDAVVSTTSDDLFKNLVHYGGSELPGKLGNAVVFGHSTLPQLYDPKNYKAIFSTLHTLKIGDQLSINIDGVLYNFSILGIKVIEANDISVLAQDYKDRFLTIITCTPPGTYWKRLVIKGKLISV